MEANLLAAEPTALALGELQHRYSDQQPQADAGEKHGKEAKEADVDGSPMLGFLMRPASIGLVATVAVVQLVRVALLVYGAYSAAVWLPL